MMDPRLLYELNPEAWERIRQLSAQGRPPVLIHLLEGYVDAGQVTRSLSKHLRESAELETLVRFDHDQLHDYRARRPVITFDTDRWTAGSALSLELSIATDEVGTEYLLLHGLEPDNQWERTIAALNHLVTQLDTAAVVTAHGAPMAVPHTRPTPITMHATESDRVHDNPRFIDRVDIPASFAAYWELALGTHGRLAMGFAALVPHYLAQTPFQQAVLAVIERINAETGLQLPVGDLAERAAQNLDDINTEMNSSEEVLEVVATLESQFDAVQASVEEGLPSADEIGAEFERFLAEQAKDEE